MPPPTSPPSALLVFFPAVCFRRRLKHHRLNEVCLTLYLLMRKKGIKAHHEHETAMGPRSSPAAGPIFTNRSCPPSCKKTPSLLSRGPFSRGDKNAWVESSCGFSRVSQSTSSASRCHRPGRGRDRLHQISRGGVTPQAFRDCKDLRWIPSPASCGCTALSTNTWPSLKVSDERIWLVVSNRYRVAQTSSLRPLITHWLLPVFWHWESTHGDVTEGTDPASSFSVLTINRGRSNKRLDLLGSSEAVNKGLHFFWHWKWDNLVLQVFLTFSILRMSDRI